MSAVWPTGHVPLYYEPIYHIPVGHLPPDPLGDPADIYSLFPRIFRTTSLLSSQLPDESNEAQSILKRITYMLEQEFQLTEWQTRRLQDLIDPDRCPPSLLSLLASVVGGEVSDDWPPGRRQVATKAIVLIWLIKATHQSWYALLRLRERLRWVPHEYYKRILYEVFDYSPTQEYYGIHSARVYFVEPDDVHQMGTHSYAQQQFEDVRLACPVHVLLVPRYHRTVEVVDVLGSTADEVGLTFPFGLHESPEDFTDELTVTDTCVHWCQSACQTAVEYACYGSCETTCEEVTETACFTYAETSCTVTCQMSCQAVCQTSCETNCETGCEVVTETGL